jgi:ABC-2 type transport system ATP-binding protein
MRIVAKVGADSAAESLARIPGVKDVSVEPNGEFTTFDLRLEAGSDPAEAVMRLATEKHWSVRELVRKRATLEDVFVELTHEDN